MLSLYCFLCSEVFLPHITRFIHGGTRIKGFKNTRKISSMGIAAITKARCAPLTVDKLWPLLSSMEVLCVSLFTVQSEIGKHKTYLNFKVCLNVGNNATKT
jgi:hypothetical protein